jgi:hypothetical protein
MIFQKRNERQQAIEAFQKKYGAENTVGLEQIILTDYMSSEHSDDGLVDQGEYAQHCRAMGGGDNGLEIRREKWQSARVCCILPQPENLLTYSLF